MGLTEAEINQRYVDMCDYIKTAQPIEEASLRFRFFVRNSMEITTRDDLPRCQKTNLELLSNLRHCDSTKEFFNRDFVGSFINQEGYYNRDLHRIFSADVLTI